MADFAWRVPKGDGRSTALSVTVNNAPVDLDGYTVTLTATQQDGTPAFTRSTLVSGPGTTSAGPDILGTDTSTAGFYVVSLRAEKAGSAGPFTSIGTLEVVDHA